MALLAGIVTRHELSLELCVKKVRGAALSCDFEEYRLLNYAFFLKWQEELERHSRMCQAPGRPESNLGIGD